MRTIGSATALLAGAGYVIVPHSSWSELLLYDTAVVIALSMAVVGWRRAEGAARRFPMCVAISLGLFLVGELLWWWFTLRGLDPYPSIADGAFLSGYVALAAAAAVLAAEGRRVRDRSAWVDAGILTAVAGLLVWQVLMEPYVGDDSVSGLYTAVTLAYPLSDLMVLGFLLVFLLSRSARDRRSSLFVAGVMATLTADLAFAYQDLQGTFVAGGWVDLVWISGYVCIGAAALTPRDRAQHVVDAVEFGVGRLLCTVLAVLVPLGVIAHELIDRDMLGLDTLGIAIVVSIVTGVLVDIRLFGLLGRARAVEQRRGEERLSSVIHHSADAIFLVDVESRITFASPAAAAFTDDVAGSCLGTTLTSWFADDPNAVVRQLENLAKMPTGMVVPINGRFLSRGGASRVIEGTACNLLDDPDVASFVVTLRDVSLRHELEAQLERRAFHDDLTGLANRALFSDRVTHAISRNTRVAESGLAVVFIDLDDFKAVNDGMGHSVGDELLAKVADRLRTCVRPADTVARFGGDEFAILIEDLASCEQAAEFAERVVEILRLPMDVGDIHLGVPASIGVAFAVPESTCESLLRDADIAMYSAKASGKSRVVVFDDKLREVASDRLSLKVDLPRALEAGQFALVYQPIHDVGGNGSLRGFEALIRWNHPTRGEIPPLDFIPLAEETGDILELGRWVLEEACRQVVVWNDRASSALTISVNVSAVQLHHPRFAADVREVLETSGLNGQLLTLEITESVLVDQHRVETILDDLRRLGVGIAIDDFGTGYSSLSYLRRFPVTSVKIDRSFVNDLVTTRDDGLVRSIISIAEALGLSTVAEGVETVAQLDLLAAIDCGLAQGFYLGRPQHLEQIDELLRTSIEADLERSGAEAARIVR